MAFGSTRTGSFLIVMALGACATGSEQMGAEWPGELGEDFSSMPAPEAPPKRQVMLSPPVSSRALAEVHSDAKNPHEPPAAPAPVAAPAPEPPPSDAHEAALRMLLKAPWGGRNDKDDTVVAPTPDWENWRRIRYFGFEHFTGFKYTDKRDVLGAVFIQDVPEGTPLKSEVCMRRFEAWARPQIEPFEVKFSPFNVKFAKWQNQPLMITSSDGELNWALSRMEFSAAWAAYPAYPNACLIFAVGIPWRDHKDLARKVRDRWVEEGFAMFEAETKERPYRQ